MPVPSIEMDAFHVDRTGLVLPIDAEPNELERAAMGMCYSYAEEAFEDGNPPIGAVLVDHERGMSWGARTVDQTERVLLGHAETRAYELAKDIVGDDLRNCSLVTSAQPCNTCTAPYAEGKIGRIIYAVPRPVIFEVCGIMRPRNINMIDLLMDGDTETTVIQGYRAQDALVLFGLYAEARGRQQTTRP